MNQTDDFILNEMDELGADGVDFAPILQIPNFPIHNIHCSYTREEWIKSDGTYPRSGRYYWRMINGRKVYVNHLKNNTTSKMKQIRCEVRGHFYIDVPDNTDCDEIEDSLGKYISNLEDLASDYITIDEYDWREYE